MTRSSQGPAGLTDKDGKFQLSTYGVNDGAVAGEHKVMVIKDDVKAAATTDPEAMLKDPSLMMNQYSKEKDDKGGK